MQVKLLRVLQEREVVRVGARRASPIDVRLIAATNVNLEAAVQAGRFRGDLYFRIAVAELELPPLRERPGDIVPLTQYFLHRYAQRMEVPMFELSPEAVAVLHAHTWPGNIRELENVVHQAVLVCRAARIEAEDLHLASRPQRTSSPPLRQSLAELRAESSLAEPMPLDDGVADRNRLWTSFDEALLPLFDGNDPEAERLFEQIDARVLRAAYDYCGHNQLATARLLGLSRNVIRARLIQYGLIRGTLRRGGSRPSEEPDNDTQTDGEP